MLHPFGNYVRDGSLATRSEPIRQPPHQTLTRDACEGDDRPVAASNQARLYR
jgi:hypothetical protein